jgi:hypothetical protein
MPKVELWQAYYWICENCGRTNFGVPEPVPLDPARKEELFRQFNHLEQWTELPEGWEDFELITAPKKVACHCCHDHFDVNLEGIAPNDTDLPGDEWKTT